MLNVEQGYCISNWTVGCVFLGCRCTKILASARIWLSLECTGP